MFVLSDPTKVPLGDIATVLKGRLTDLNKAVQLLALDAVAKIATGMNKPFEKYCKILVLPVAQVTADQKVPIRAAGVATLSAIAEACEGIDPMAHFMGSALESPNPLQRSTLLGWLADWLKNESPASTIDMSNWVSPVLAALEDRSPDVRKSAQTLLPFVVARIGADRVMEKTNALKPASRSAIVPLIMSAKALAPVPNATTPGPKLGSIASNTTSKAGRATPDEAGGLGSAPAMPAAPQRKGLLARKFGISSSRPASRAENENEHPNAPGSPLSTMKAKAAGLKGPASMGSKVALPDSASPSALFTTANPDAKRSRLSKDAGRWIIESGPTRKDLVETLQHQMEPHCSSELMALLFSKDHHAVNDHISALGLICDVFDGCASGSDSNGVSADVMSSRLLANIDLSLKYVSLRIHEPQPNLISKCLDVVDSAVSFLANAAYALSDLEAATFIPTIIHKVNSFDTSIQTLFSLP